MTDTRKTRIPREEQINLITECRNSGMTDAEWCRQNGIAPSTFYNWVTRRRRAACPIPVKKHHEQIHSKPDVVPVEVVSDPFPTQHTIQQISPKNSNKTHSLEIAMKDITIRICNDVDTELLSQTIRLIRESIC